MGNIPAPHAVFTCWKCPTLSFQWHCTLLLSSVKLVLLRLAVNHLHAVSLCCQTGLSLSWSLCSNPVWCPAVFNLTSGSQIRGDSPCAPVYQPQLTEQKYEWSSHSGHILHIIPIKINHEIVPKALVDSREDHDKVPSRVTFQRPLCTWCSTSYSWYPFCPCPCPSPCPCHCH